MDRFEQIIERLNVCIKRWWIPIVIALFIFVVAMLVVVWHCYSPELAKFLVYSIGVILVSVILAIWRIVIASRRATAAETTAKAMQETAKLTERGNIAERFKNAIGDLDNDSAAVQLGGIYALHHIAQEVEDYQKRVFEILCAYIRGTTTSLRYRPRNAGSTEIKPTIQIQSILDLLFIKTPDREIYKGLYVDLEDANLQGASFMSADLQGARLISANLHEANLRGANLQSAILCRTNLQKADLRGANLQDADLREAELQNAKLWGAELQDAILFEAKLQKAELWRADFKNTTLLNANLYKADLMDAKNLTVKQLLEAKTLYETGLPDGMEEEIRKENSKLFDPPKAKQES